MAQIFYEPLARAFTNTGAVGEGYKYYFYTTLTSTPIPTYTTPALNVQNPYPVEADANGRFPPIWVSDLSQVKVVLTDANDVVIETQDPAGATSANTSLNDLDVRPTSYWGLTTGTASAYELTANPSISSYSNVQTLIFQAHIANTINPTMAVSGLSALNLKKYTGQGTKVGLQAGDLQATERYLAIIDGVDIVVLNPRSLPLNLGTPPTLTIAAGVVTLTNVGSAYLIDTEGAAATDDLDTINGFNDGLVISVGSVASARNVILKHNTGNIFNPAGFDIVLETLNDRAVLQYSSTLAKWIVTSTKSLTPIMIVRDEKANTTTAGNSSAGANTRVLNTTQVNTISGASLGSNQVTLPAGTYKITGSTPSYAANQHQAYLYNTTDAAVSIVGESTMTTGVAVTTRSSFTGVITIAAQKVFELRQYIQFAGVDGLGYPASSGNVEVYSTLVIEKIG